MQKLLYIDKREALQEEYSQPPILPSPHFLRVVNRKNRTQLTRGQSLSVVRVRVVSLIDDYLSFGSI